MSSMSLEASADNGATFNLEHFEWMAPDRLEISGSFVGMDQPDSVPVLVVYGSAGVRRLNGVAGARGNGSRSWNAVFEWQEPPIAFDVAELELGDVAVLLPAPGHDRHGGLLRLSSPRALADVLRMEMELLAAREEVREARAAEAQSGEQLERTRSDLEAERQRLRDGSQRYQEGLAAAREAAEQAVAVAETQLSALRERVAELEGQTGNVAVLRTELEHAASEAASIRRDLEQVQADRDQMGAERDRLRVQLQQTQQTLEHAKREAEAAAHLRARMDAIRRALEGQV